MALTLLQANTFDEEDDDTPASLTRLLQQRLDRLTAEAAHALAVAATLGYRIDYAVWSAIIAAETLVRLARELEEAGLLVLEPAGYRFAHDTLRAYVYESLESTERQDLHRRVLAALESRRR